MRATRVSPSRELIVQQQTCDVTLLREWLFKSSRHSPIYLLERVNYMTMGVIVYFEFEGNVQEYERHIRIHEYFEIRYEFT